MKFFIADSSIFKKRIVSFFLPTKSWKQHPQKLPRKTQIHFFFHTAWAAQTAQTEEFILQNVAYRPSVYRTGVYRVYFLYCTSRHDFRFGVLCSSYKISSKSIHRSLDGWIERFQWGVSYLPDVSRSHFPSKKNVFSSYMLVWKVYREYTIAILYNNMTSVLEFCVCHTKLP